MRIISQTFDSEEERKEEAKEERPKPAYISFKHTLPVTQLIDLKRIGNKKEFGIILRESTFESNDSYLIDLAVGLRADFIVVGPPQRSSRIEKYNRYLEISETLNN
jgi:enolase